MTLTYLDRHAATEDVVSALRRDGAVAVNELVWPDIIDAVTAELRPKLDPTLKPTGSD